MIKKMLVLVYVLLGKEKDIIKVNINGERVNIVATVSAVRRLCSYSVSCVGSKAGAVEEDGGQFLVLHSTTSTV